MATHSSPAAVRPAPLPPSQQVLVLVDFINPLNFPGAEQLLPHAWRAAQAAARFKRRLAARHIPAIYANDNYGTWQSDFEDVLAQCRALPGQRGAIAELMAPQPTDLTILKPRHSAFFATPLDMLLREMGARQLIILGLAADICVHFTAVDAFMRGYSIWVPSDCVASESVQAQRAALAHVARTLKCSTRRSTSRSPFDDREAATA